MIVNLIYLAFCTFSFSNQGKLIRSDDMQKTLLPADSLVTYTGEYHVTGVVKESKKGICGKKCIGGYIRIKLQYKLVDLKDKDIYVITGCGEIKMGSKINFVIKQLKGDEPECMYRKYFRPRFQTSRPFYRIIHLNTR